MKSHWKSSENSLYVRIIWKKGARHVILHNDELHIRKRRSIHVSPRPEPTITPNDENLETCLSKLKLDNKERNIPVRAVSCEPTLLCTPVCKVVARPSYPLNTSYFYVNNLQNEYHRDESQNEIIDDCLPDAFTDRILQWLSSSSASVNVVSCTEDTIKINRKPIPKERPKTSPGNGLQKISISENCIEEEYQDDCSVTQCGRPQLHVFVPIFENDRIQYVRKCKSLDDT